MAYLEELLPEFRKGAKIRRTGVPQPANAKGYIFYKEGKIYNEFGRECDPDLGLWLSKNDWEIYQEPIDWKYIIDHKCLCWFGGDCQNKGRFGILVNVNYDENFCFPYKESWGDVWEDCRPARRDEVTFYEDKKDD